MVRPTGRRPLFFDCLVFSLLIAGLWWNARAEPGRTVRTAGIDLRVPRSLSEGPALRSRAVVSGTNPSFTTYTVSNAAAFQALWLPLPSGSLVFWNGLMITPGFDYQVVGSTFAVSSDPLAAGDRITVVTFQ